LHFLAQRRQQWRPGSGVPSCPASDIHALFARCRLIRLITAFVDLDQEKGGLSSGNTMTIQTSDGSRVAKELHKTAEKNLRLSEATQIY